MVLSSPGVAKQIQEKIKQDINDWVIKHYDGGHRTHLGASLIGDECKRKLWYVFRWAGRETGTDKAAYARKLRLFNRGHREEARFVEWLEGIGCKVWFENREGLMYHPESDSYWIAEGEENPDGLSVPVAQDCLSPEAYANHVGRAKLQGLEFPQFRVSDVMGHFGGSLDGICLLPPHYGIKEPVLLEFKTNGTGPGFAKLEQNGMAKEKAQHFAQTSTYGCDPAYGFEYVLYMNNNKNDDSMHVELVKLNHNLGRQMRIKAEQIITSQVPPPRLSDNITYKLCSWCDMKEMCHQGKPPEVNCRSCVNARPVENAQWFCEQHNSIIPKEFIPNACPQYKAIG